MALDPVPWAVGHGAENSVEGARLSLYAATSGARGVVQPNDMRVSALPIPGTAVRVHTGACVTPNDYPGGQSQAYAMRETSSTDVPVLANTSNGTHIRFLVARVEDDQYAGPTPSDVVNGPYNRYEWLASNPELNPPAFPHVPLARLDLPANQHTVTDDMLTDLRVVANPRREEVLHFRPRVSGDDASGTTLTRRTTEGGEYFPGSDWQGDVIRIDIPDYATRMTIEATWMGVLYQGGRNAYGSYWVEYGDEYRPWTWPGNRQWEFSTDWISFNAAASSNNQRIVWEGGDSVAVPAKLRGKKNVAFALKAGLHPNAQTGVSVDYTGALKLRVTFAEVAIDEDTL